MKRSPQTGFSLIELLIAVAILGIIMAIAVPSYSNYITESRRVDAHIGLHSAAQEMERCRSQSFTYVGCESSFPKASPEGYYTISINAGLTARAFTATATPTSGKSQASDSKCTTLTIDQTGFTDSTQTDSTDSSASDCW